MTTLVLQCFPVSDEAPEKKSKRERIQFLLGFVRDTMVRRIRTLLEKNKDIAPATVENAVEVFCKRIEDALMDNPEITLEELLAPITAQSAWVAKEQRHKVAIHIYTLLKHLEETTGVKYIPRIRTLSS